MSESPEVAGTGGGAEEGEGRSHLAPEDQSDPNGHWPSWQAKLRNDFRSHRNAKANDGLVTPKIEDPPWTDEPGVDTEVLLEAARRRHDQALARSEVAEARSHRIAQTGLTLLAIAFLIVGFVATRIQAGGLWWMWGVLGVAVCIAPIALLALVVVQAIGVDRVGYTVPAQPAEAARFEDAAAQRRSLIRQEMRAATMANWTARKKINEFLQARAWLTRAMASLVLSGIAACVVWLTVDPPAVPPSPVRVEVTVPTPSETNPPAATTPMRPARPTTTSAPPSPMPSDPGP